VTATAAVTEPVDWALARTVGRKLAGTDAMARPYIRAGIEHELRDLTARAEALVSEFTGLVAPGPAHAAVLSRAQWVDANVASMQRLLAPVTARVGERLSKSPFAPVGRRAAGVELGGLLGLMGQRVLGQYDLLLLEETDSASDAVYYVGANIMKLETRHHFMPSDFRLWIAIHECTHRAQFTGVPWMRSHFLALVERLLGFVDPDPKRLISAVARAAEEMRHGRNPVDDGLISILATPEQKAVLDEVQALMSLLEGHGNAVMNRLGRQHVKGQARMARTLDARRKAGGLMGVVNKLLGLEMKLRQYEVGERFVDAVAETAGLAALDAAWAAPENLPTLAELEDAPAWLARVSG